MNERNVVSWSVGERSHLTGEQRRAMLEMGDGSVFFMSKTTLQGFVAHCLRSALLLDVRDGFETPGKESDVDGESEARRLADEIRAAADVYNKAVMAATKVNIETEAIITETGLVVVEAVSIRAEL